jgi:hypothetical protein
MIQPSLPSSCALPAAAARAVLATLASFAAVAGMALVAAPVAQAADWLQFNHDSRHSGANLEESTIPGSAPSTGRARSWSMGAST